MGDIVVFKEPTEEQVDLIKRTVAKGATNDELALFLYQAKRTGLDPLLRQIHAVKRWSEGREVMAIQTGIDGYRLIADRTERYTPGRATTFEHDDNGKLVSATAFIKKLVAGEWHEVTATAYYDEYVQKKRDGNPNRFWKGMPHNQLAKCAEALALRRAFPAELSGLYTHEEMQQADNMEVVIPATGEVVKRDDGTEVELEPPPPKVTVLKVLDRINAIKDIEALQDAETWWGDNKGDYPEVQQKMIVSSLDKKHNELTSAVKTFNPTDEEDDPGAGPDEALAGKAEEKAEQLEKLPVLPTYSEVQQLRKLAQDLGLDNAELNKLVDENFGENLRARKTRVVVGNLIKDEWTVIMAVLQEQAKVEPKQPPAPTAAKPPLKDLSLPSLEELRERFPDVKETQLIMWADKSVDALEVVQSNFRKGIWESIYSTERAKKQVEDYLKLLIKTKTAAE